ncbi:MAG: D-alanyl-D-alanine carboxypeptidase [Ruminococcaceae bacterium]|nr:D-alanyl-D-alanine carboxypeptidase [Oscillospiraceae bacterium]
MKKTIFFILFCFLFSFNVGANPSVSARSAVLINGTTGEVIFSKNQSEQLPMASTTKIMTALLLAEENTPQKQVTVTKQMVTVEGSSMGLLPGDTVSYNDLLYGLLLASGNDAANSVAYLLGGSLEGFAKLMNLKAKQLGLLHTNFVTPSGLDNENHYTTAYDLARLAQYAMKNEAFYTAASSKNAVLNYGNPPYRRQLTNHNKLLNLYDGAVGVKTGFTKKSGRCLVSAARRNNEYLIAVTLSAPNDWQDHKAMLDFGFEAFVDKTFDFKEQTINVPVVSGEIDRVTVNIPSLTVAVANEKNSDFSTECLVPKFLYAPLKEGDIVGQVVLKYKDEVIKSENLICEKEIKIKIEKKTFLDSFFQIFLLLIKQI